MGRYISLLFALVAAVCVVHGQSVDPSGQASSAPSSPATLPDVNPNLSLDEQLSEAGEDLAAAPKALDDARAEVSARLAQQPAFFEATQRAKVAAARLEALRNAKSDELPDASLEWLRLQSIVNRLIDQAMANDVSLRVVRSRYSQLSARVYVLTERVRVRDLEAARASNEAAAARAERTAEGGSMDFNLPMDWGNRTQWVNGYYRSNGTYVNGYYRSPGR